MTILRFANNQKVLYFICDLGSFLVGIKECYLLMNYLLESRNLLRGYQILYARHYNPRFVYFLPTFEVQKRFFKGIFLKILALCMVSIQERFLIKSGL